MTALELVGVGLLASTYMVGFLWTYNLWKKTEVEEEKIKVESLVNSAVSPYPRY